VYEVGFEVNHPFRVIMMVQVGPKQQTKLLYAIVLPSNMTRRESVD
jgi:hypothetical protein